jgi:hypothetical protein
MLGIGHPNRRENGRIEHDAEITTCRARRQRVVTREHHPARRAETCGRSARGRVVGRTSSNDMYSNPCSTPPRRFKPTQRCAARDAICSCRTRRQGCRGFGGDTTAFELRPSGGIVSRDTEVSRGRFTPSSAGESLADAGSSRPLEAPNGEVSIHPHGRGVVAVPPSL